MSLGFPLVQDLLPYDSNKTVDFIMVGQTVMYPYYWKLCIRIEQGISQSI